MHPSRSAQQLSRPLPLPPPQHRHSGEYLAEAPPLPIRFANLPQRGASPPHPLEQDSAQPEPADESEASSGQGWADPFSYLEQLMRSQPPSTESDADRSGPKRQPESPTEAAEKTHLAKPPSLLLLDMPQAVSDSSEHFPLFELPVRSSPGSRLHLPIIPTSRESTPDTPRSRATFRRVE